MLQNNANIQKENLIKNWNYTYESSIFAKIKSIFLFRLVKVNPYPLTLNIHCPYVPPLKNTKNWKNKKQKKRTVLRLSSFCAPGWA